MDVDITKNNAHTECIRCGECIKACPTQAISTHWGFETFKNETNLTGLLENENF